MKNIISISTILLLFLTYYAYAMDNLLFAPPLASQFEPRSGCIYLIQDDKLRLDIGASLDLIEVQKSEISTTVMGADFFTFTRLRSEGRFKFPVETSDYFFGINASNIMKINGLTIGTRLRLSHISSHLVDGFSKNGIFDKKPFVYSREFVDILFALEDEPARPYIGISYVFSVIPDNVNIIIPQIGMDYSRSLTDWMELKAGYDFRLGGYDGSYTAIHSFQCGLLFMTMGRKGVSINYYYYSGQSMHGMFYTDKDKYSGIGIQINFQ